MSYYGDHWKHRATRCAVEGCERQRRKGWSTCDLYNHYRLGKSLYGAGKIEPIPALAAELPDVPSLAETSLGED